MPKTISMDSINQAGINLFKFGGTLFPCGVSVEMYGQKMVIKENGVEVFSMKKVAIIDNGQSKSLIIDYPKTKEGEDGRGWGILGMLVALCHGRAKGCGNVELGSEIEMTHGSVSLWSKFGIAKKSGRPLASALDLGIEWVKTHCTQASAASVDFVLRDKTVAVTTV